MDRSWFLLAFAAGCGNAPDPRVDALQTEVDTLRAEVAALQNENAALQTTVDGLASNAVTDALTSRQDVLEDTVTDHDARLTTLEDDAELATLSEAAQDSQIAALESGTAATVVSVTALETTVADLGTELTSAEAAIAENDVKAQCLARMGTWDGSACTEFVTIGCESCNWTTALASCPMDRHLCSTTELEGGALASLYSQLMAGLVTTTQEFVWSRGWGTNTPTVQGNQFYHPFPGYATGPMTCASGAAPLVGFTNRNTPMDNYQTGARGCYDKTYTSAISACCRSDAY